MRLRALLLILLVAVLLGCSEQQTAEMEYVRGDGADQEVPQAGDRDANDAISDDAPPGPTVASDVTSPEEEPPEGVSPEQPLADFFGWDDQDADVEHQEQQARIEESVRRCMAEQGFDYRPVIPPDEALMNFDDLDAEEWAHTRGFGITTWYGRDDGSLVDVEWSDPNQDSTEAMPDAEREAWQAALYGSRGLVEGQSEESATAGDQGCKGEAYEEESRRHRQSQEMWEELRPALDDLRERVEADSRIVTAHRDWARCMSEAGYEPEGSRAEMLAAAYADFHRRLEQIVGPNMGAVDPFEGWTEEEIRAFHRDNGPDEIEALHSAAQEEAREGVDMDAVSALQQEEIEMAVADFECSEGLSELYSEVRAEYEADFLASNREDLEEIRDLQDR